jgi:hypothetical protein
MSFDVQIVNDDGEGVEGVRVVLGFTSLLRGMSAAEFTDADGHAEFDGYDDGEVEVFVDGSSYGNFTYEDGSGITITM